MYLCVLRVFSCLFHWPHVEVKEQLSGVHSLLGSQTYIIRFEDKYLYWVTRTSSGDLCHPANFLLFHSTKWQLYSCLCVSICTICLLKNIIFSLFHMLFCFKSGKTSSVQGSRPGSISRCASWKWMHLGSLFRFP